MDRPTLRRASRSTSWRPRTRAPSSPASDLLTHEQAAAKGASVAAVVIGDSPEEATFDNLNRAFRLIKGGATLVGMHRNPWWLTPEGPTLDSGSFVVGLEFAAETRATVVGKPSTAFFSQAVRDLRREAGRDLARADIAMVGDDVRTDVRAAQRAGLRGILVLSGKHGAGRHRAGRRESAVGGCPDAVAPSLADVVAALDAGSSAEALDPASASQGDGDGLDAGASNLIDATI